MILRSSKRPFVCDFGERWAAAVVVASTRRESLEHENPRFPPRAPDGGQSNGAFTKVSTSTSPFSSRWTITRRQPKRISRPGSALRKADRSTGFQHYSFPSTASFLAADDDLLCAAGLSVGKLMTLLRVGEALAVGTLDATVLEQQASPDAAAILCRIKGIGPWIADVILLRGLGRLDVFPMNDTSVTRNLALVSGSAAVDVESTLRVLSPQQGVLYYYLLLARLEAQRDLCRASVPAWFGR